MANPNNHGTIIGNVAADPTFFINEDGSKRVSMTIYSRRNFRNRTTGQRDSDRVSLETWVSASTEGLGIFDHVHTGDLVNAHYTVRSAEYADKLTGEIVYAQQLRIEAIQLLDSKATTTARLARRLSATQEALRDARQPESEPVATKARNSRQKVAQPA